MKFEKNTWKLTFHHHGIHSKTASLAPTSTHHFFASKDEISNKLIKHVHRKLEERIQL